MHRQAARLDDRYELVAGVLSSDPQRSRTAGLEIGLAPGRAYSNVLEMLDSEAARPDGADVVAIMTPTTAITNMQSRRWNAASMSFATSP